MSFSDGLNTTASLYLDTAGAGATDVRMGPLESFTAVSGFQDVPCRAVQKKQSLNTDYARPTTRQCWRLLFGKSVVCDVRNVWHVADPDTGATRYLRPTGNANNAHGMNHHWVVECEEVPL